MPKQGIYADDLALIKAFNFLTIVELLKMTYTFCQKTVKYEVRTKPNNRSN